MDKHILYNFFSGKTSDLESTQVLDWMDETEENKKKFFEERKLYDMMMLANDDIFNRSSFSGNKANLILYIKKFIQVAAIFIFAITISYFYFEKKKHAEPIVTMNTITVPSGQRANLTLGDGTNIWLNARTTLQYPTAFTSATFRKVKLDGEAFFDVAKDEKKPFIIETSNYTVEVTGTQFNLQAYSENEVFETALMEGSVKIAPTNNIQQITILKPNEKVIDINGQLQVNPIVDYDPFRWKEGLICFKDKPFNLIMYEFEKTYGVKIVINNKKVLRYFYTGKFRQSDGINHALRVLQLSIKFHFQRDDESNIVYIQ